MAQNKLDHSYEIAANFNEQFQIVPHHLQQITKVFRNWKDAELIITIRKFRKSRTGRQNRYYWGVIVPYVKNFKKETEGITVTKDDIHLYHLQKVMGLQPDTKEVMGEVLVYFTVKSTSDMDTKEFTEFVEEVRAHWAKKGLDIPDPVGESLLTDYIQDN
jgi:hypothetical protein